MIHIDNPTSKPLYAMSVFDGECFEPSNAAAARLIGRGPDSDEPGLESVDLYGRRIGRLTVIGRTGNLKRWEVLCECGRMFSCTERKLRDAATKCPACESSGEYDREYSRSNNLLAAPAEDCTVGA